MVPTLQQSRWTEFFGEQCYSKWVDENLMGGLGTGLVSKIKKKAINSLLGVNYVLVKSSLLRGDVP